MKKVYKKPVVMIERFELAEHIAGCGKTTVAHPNSAGKPNHYDGYTCEFVSDFGDPMFLDGNKDCVDPQFENDMEIGCYNTPDGINSFFSS